jgi:hypothetical protein
MPGSCEACRKHKGIESNLDWCTFTVLRRWGESRVQDVAQWGREFFDGRPAMDLCKTPSAQIHRRTAVNASEKVTPVLPGQRIAPTRRAAGSSFSSDATIGYSPNKHRVTRITVLRHQPPAVPRCKQERTS